ARLLTIERTRYGISRDVLADRLKVPVSELDALETGVEPAEAWGVTLADLAVALGVPISRFIAETGRPEDYQPGNCGRLARDWRERCGLSLDQLVAKSGIAREQLDELERGTSPAERWLPRLLGIAQALDQPLFNFFYPYGVPLKELDAYV